MKVFKNGEGIGSNDFGGHKMGVNVSDAEFDKEVLEKSKELPVVVDFWASWCVPCTILGPVLEKIAKEFEGKFVLAKVNVDENPVSSSKFRISSIPSVKLFKNGEVVDEFVGVVPEQTVREWVEKNL